MWVYAWKGGHLKLHSRRLRVTRKCTFRDPSSDSISLILTNPVHPVSFVCRLCVCIVSPDRDRSQSMIFMHCTRSVSVLLNKTGQLTR